MKNKISSVAAAVSSVSTLICSSASGAIQTFTFPKSFELEDVGGGNFMVGGDINEVIQDGTSTSVNAVLFSNYGIDLNPSFYVAVSFFDNNINGLDQANAIYFYSYYGSATGEGLHNIGLDTEVGAATTTYASPVSGMAYASSGAAALESSTGIVSGELNYMGFRTTNGAGDEDRYLIIEFIAEVSGDHFTEFDLTRLFVSSDEEGFAATTAIPEANATGLAVLALGAAGVLRNRRKL